MSNIKTELQKAQTLKEFFDIFQKEYDTDNCKLGFITKPILISNIDKLVQFTQVKPRKK
jgi:hypothetical protein